MLLLLPLITLFFLLYFYRKKNKKFGVVTLLLTVYILMSSIGVLFHFYGILVPVKSISFIAMIYLSFSLFIVFTGFIEFRESNVEKIFIRNKEILILLETFLLIGSIFSIIFFLPFARDALTGDAGENRQQMVANSLSDIEAPLQQYGLINSFASWFGNMFIVTQMFFFLNLIRKNSEPFKAYLMLGASLSYVIYILAYVGRDGMVYWSMSFLFQYLFFKKFLTSTSQKLILRLFYVLVPILLIPFFMITISRFQESELGFYLSLGDYMGQQALNFSDFFQVDALLQNGNLNFPVIVSFWKNLGLPFTEISVSEFNAPYLKEGIQPWVFTTFVGSFIIDFGKTGALLLLFFLHFLTKRCIRSINKHRYISIDNYILLIFLYQIVYWGVFYFRQYSANFYIIGMVLLYFILKVRNSKSSYFLVVNNK